METATSHATGGPPLACRRPRTSAVEEVRRGEIYRWTDANGIVTFSDQPSPGNDVQVTPYQITETRQLNLAYRGVGGAFPFTLQQSSKKDAEWLYRLVGSLVGDEHLRRVDVNVLLFHRPNDFLAHRRKNAPMLQTTSGYYDRKTSTAIVQKHGKDDRTRSVIRHETMHLLLDALIGQLPPWLSEGLAEYAEGAPPKPPSGRVTPHQLAAMSYQDFHGANESEHYRLAHTLVHRLMSTPQGRQKLSRFLRQTLQSPCEVQSGIELL